MCCQYRFLEVLLDIGVISGVILEAKMDANLQ